MEKPTLLWFKRDLRVADHPALALAAALGQPVLPLYVVEPELWQQPDRSARQWAFAAECLAELRADLAALGQPLILRVGEAVDVLARLHRATGFARILSHEETGTLWTFRRDRRVAHWAREQGIEWQEVPQSAVVRKLAGRDGWAARRDAFLRQPMPAPPALAPMELAPGQIPSARALGLAGDACPHRQTGGRSAGLALMDSFLDLRGRNYRAAMASPLGGERGCSRLSPHLAQGVLSGREVAQAAAAAKEARRSQPGWPAALKSFEARLAWRDHFMQKLEDAPELEARCLHSAHEHLRPRSPDPVRLAAWAAGETGLPFVDASMRYLAATGWLNFRMRAMLMSVASYHLWLDWRATGAHLARLFTDYEPGIHWSQCQMQSGVTGINALRIYNPVRQGHVQDPDGSFTRRWCPELSDLPDAFLQEPWKWPGAARLLGRRYPEPVVDPAMAARGARAAFAELRRATGFAEEAGRVLQRHGSRRGKGTAKGRGGSERHRSAAPGSAQLSFDF